jgi:hypothetical protein
MLYSVIIKKLKHMSTFKVEETIVKTIKRVYFVDTESDEEAVHIVMRNKKDVDEEIEGKEIVTGYEVKRARFKRFTIKAT